MSILWVHRSVWFLILALGGALIASPVQASTLDEFAICRGVCGIAMKDYWKAVPGRAEDKRRICTCLSRDSKQFPTIMTETPAGEWLGGGLTVYPDGRGGWTTEVKMVAIPVEEKKTVVVVEEPKRKEDTVVVPVPPIVTPVVVPSVTPSPKPKFAFNMVDRPLTLNEEMFEIRAGVHMDYTVGSGFYYDELLRNDEEWNWGGISAPISLRVGITDELEVMARATAGLDRPGGLVLEPGVSITYSPASVVALSVDLLLPDSQYEDQLGVGFAARTKFPFLASLLAGTWDASFLYNASRDITRFQMMAGLLVAPVSRVWLAFRCGVTLEDMPVEQLPYGSPTPEDVRIPLEVELGFASAKQVDIYLRWGTHGDFGNDLASVRFLLAGLAIRL